ncbi:MAG TPA: hypothetical protein VFO77_07180, partial [Actinoplanes sp.]|nr:hypothetical protein [Actinoplanes sp.]
WDGLGFTLATPAVWFGSVAALVLLLVAAQRLPSWWRERPAARPGGRRWPAAAALTTAGLLLTAAGLVSLLPRDVAGEPCTPSAPVGVVDPPDARLSYQARVYVSAQATDDQRNLAQAAIGRGLGNGMRFEGDPSSAAFLAAYCAHGRPEAAVADALPRYWIVDLASPGLFAGLAAETIVMPGVVAVQHVPL